MFADNRTAIKLTIFLYISLKFPGSVARWLVCESKEKLVLKIMK